MSRRTVTLAVGAVLLLGLALLGSVLRVPYVMLESGITVNTLGSTNGEEVVSLNGGAVDDHPSGQLRLTTVGVRDEVDLLSALHGWLSGDISVVPREEIFPPGETENEIERENSQEFVDSQGAAETAAFAELGFPAHVVVRQFTDNSPSRGLLREGDALTRINGATTDTFDQLTSALEVVPPGDEVVVDYLRDGQPGTARIPTIESPEREGAALGIAVAEERVANFDPTFALADIGGPSAGLMFALAIVEKADAEDLTSGRVIAGTGTIAADGAVGAIGGITQKLNGAKRDGASVFLLPADNCSEAKQTAPSDLLLVKVESLHSAVEALRQIRDGGSPPQC